MKRVYILIISFLLLSVFYRSIYSETVIEQVINKIKANNNKINTLQEKFVINNQIIYNQQSSTTIKGNLYIKGDNRRFEITEPESIKTTLVFLNGNKHILKGKMEENRIVPENSELFNEKGQEDFKKNLAKEFEKKFNKKPEVKINNRTSDIGKIGDPLAIINEFKNQKLRLIKASATECTIEAKQLNNTFDPTKEIIVDLRTGNVSKVIYYSPTGEKFQESKYHYVNVSGIWIIKKININIDIKQRNLKVNSVMTFDNIKVNSELSDNLFQINE